MFHLETPSWTRMRNSWLRYIERAYRHRGPSVVLKLLSCCDLAYPTSPLATSRFLSGSHPLLYRKCRSNDSNLLVETGWTKNTCVKDQERMVGMVSGGE